MRQGAQTLSECFKDCQGRNNRHPYVTFVDDFGHLSCESGAEECTNSIMHPSHMRPPSGSSLPKLPGTIQLLSAP